MISPYFCIAHNVWVSPHLFPNLNNDVSKKRTHQKKKLLVRMLRGILGMFQDISNQGMSLLTT